jgi:hypothetical protein
VVQFHRRFSNIIRKLSILGVAALSVVGALSLSTKVLFAAGPPPPERAVKVVPAQRAPAVKQTSKKKLRPLPARPLPAPLADVGPKAGGRLSAAELAGLAHEYDLHITKIIVDLQSLVAEAKLIGEPFRLNCLLDKYFQANNYKGVARRALVRFEEAMTAKDEELSFRHYNNMATAHQAVEYFAEQAAACASSSGFQSTRLQLQGSPPTAKESDAGSGSEGNPAQQAPSFPIPDRPPFASPYI